MARQKNASSKDGHLKEKFRLTRTSAKELEIQKMEAENAEMRKQVELPFLYGWKWYKWAWDFFESRNKVNLLCAANQISKSSTQIRKAINWATDQKVWGELWERQPVQFWYLYPTQKQVNAEFETKWKLFLPRGAMEKDDYYGWKVEKNKGDVVAIHFNSGVHIYFKTYAQSNAALQTGTVDALFADEELPVEIFDELMLRISSSNGYFHMVFTATIGQDFWRRAMEPGQGEKEELPQAFKQTVSLYEAMEYMDGGLSQWSHERIKMVEARCSTHNEVLKRVYGRFIMVGGRKYEAFDIKRHVKPAHPIPSSWLIYEGVDIGGGGPDAHKSSIVFIAVRPDYRAGRVFLGWRGSDSEHTTAGDVFVKHQNLVKENKLKITRKFYDWSNKDFGEIAMRNHDPFEKAEKSHTIGEDVINTLFKNDMLYIYDTPELMKLAGELASLLAATSKRTAKDDFCDGLRYGVTKIPWDWTVITGAKDPNEANLENPLTDVEQQLNDRRQRFENHNDSEEQRINAEFNEWNDAYEF